jgi:hypothetical protein
MPRRNQISSEISSVKKLITRQLSDSPINPIGDKLLELIAVLEADEGAITDSQARKVLKDAHVMVNSLPKSFEPRFYFDSAMISSIAEDWSEHSQWLSGMILPNHRNEWGHLTVPMPCWDGSAAHSVDVILLPGDDDLSDIDLLEYPWITHELGHNLHFRNEHFIDLFQAKLDKRIGELRSLAVADRGAAKQRSSETVDFFDSVWRPSRDHSNWSHEIAMDVVALWTCGPAFIASYEDNLDRNAPDPFLIDGNHPPYHLRTLALVDAASRLDWSDYLSPLTARANDWNMSAPDAFEYAVLHDDEMLITAVTCGLSFCNALKLPRLDPVRMREIRNSVAQGKSFEFGTSLLVGAWAANQSMKESDYDNWHARMTQELADSVTLEFRQ